MAELSQNEKARRFLLLTHIEATLDGVISSADRLHDDSCSAEDILCQLANIKVGAENIKNHLQELY